MIAAITNRAGEIEAPDWLTKAEVIHRQLRPALPRDYLGKMRRVFRGGGRMIVATHDSDVVGVAVYRVHENTADEIHMYVDDLVTDAAKRSTGIGKTLLDHLQSIARDLGCDQFKLDSGTQRHEAHKFYFREGMVVTAFHFGKTIAKKA